ncbi:hypothetical protein A3862_05040 [Methylobacterium sp. XJLW]|nr:hypothetical protein A3862_05040 [Methylobacterium sp. XJLW]
MPTAETDLQIAIVVGVPGPSGPGQRRLLDEKMGRDEDAAPHAGVALRQREGRDRGAIGMADQQAASQSREVEDLGKYGAGFMFEKVGPAGQRHGTRGPITLARESQDTASGLLDQNFRQRTPLHGRTETLMKQHQRRRQVRLRTDEMVFQP